MCILRCARCGHVHSVVQQSILWLIALLCVRVYLRARVYMCAHCLSFGLWLECLNASASLVYFTVRVRVRTHKRADLHDLTMACFLQVVPVFWAEIWDKLEQM